MASLIYAFDPNWSLSLVPSLSNICLHWIVNNFEENPIFEKLSQIQKDFVQERLSTSLPLHVTASLVPDGVYWKRCCKERWDICDVSHYGDSWKRMFFERHLENIIEGFIPEVTEPKTVLDLVPPCRNYIKKLDISQLLLPTKEPQLKKVEEKSDWSLKIDVDEPHVDHFDFSILLDKLTNLEELHLVYRVKQCGMSFEWAMFQMTDKDCKSLAYALKSCKTLKLFRLHQSHVDDEKCRLLVKYLLDHPSLRELDFSHNLIGDSAARAIGKLLTRSKLEVLNMCNNRISGPGAKAIAHALSSNSTLLVLNLRLNRVMDEGGQAIGKALLNNTTLSYLHLGGNDVTSVTAFALSKVLTENKTLKRINLSCNKLGEVGGKALAEAMARNSTITECDIRMTDIDEEAASTINKVVWANQSSEF
ncbi:dynein regulatory complex subunit 5 [Melanotaenia boesemani]|uniref:dynein regulatory complex subunit 5 n=1 Tax=Melanotaenia boesemani TaxID=1250792 RepID=UPI001C04C8BF|nr:dynein regulatory complex subunit 5 [Melanotaenia boesemani]